MMQKRVTSGKIFEDSISTKEWIKSPTKPNFKWNGIGRNNFEKIINSKYDPKNFYLLPESTFDKWDLLSVNDSTKTADAKRYKNNKLNSWTLYSEPFFKMATRKDIGKIDKDKYNQFVNEFYPTRRICKVCQRKKDDLLEEKVPFKKGYMEHRNEIVR